MKKSFLSLNSDLGKQRVRFLLKILISVCMVLITLLIRSRQDLFVSENGHIGTFEIGFLSLLIIGVFLEWKKIYHIILAIFTLLIVFHLGFINSALHLTGKIILVSIDVIAISLLIAIIKLKKN